MDFIGTSLAGGAGRIRFALIDPGTNCAIRTVDYEYANGVLVSRTLVAQRLFRLTGTGDSYIERMNMLALRMSECAELGTVDAYLLEQQFESNVVITLGVIIGIIAALRKDEMRLRQKRTGTICVERMSYEVFLMNASIKSDGIAYASSLAGIDFAAAAMAEVCPIRPKKMAAKDKSLALKTAGIYAAKYIAASEEETMALLLDTKADDVADLVCYECALWFMLLTGMKKR